jgi:hypothetical protein
MKFTACSILAGLALTIAVGILPAATPKKAAPRELLPPTLSWLRNVEAAQMLGAIVSGTPPESGDMGWFHPGQSQYSLKWLLERMDKDRDGAISKKEFTGPGEWFERLDRDHDGKLTKTDFDWSDDAPLNRQMRIVHQLFRRVDADHNERITAKEWQAMFQQLANGRESLRRDELHALLFPPPPQPTPKKHEPFLPEPVVIVKGLFEGDLGSFHEGPAVGRPAPDFTLPRYDEDKPISLAQFRGKKPMVLIFGSFT